MILVKYRDGKCARVPEQFLSELIAAGSITHFRRGHGWAQIGRDPVRRQSFPLFGGREKRSTWRISLE